MNLVRHYWLNHHAMRGLGEKMADENPLGVDSGEWRDWKAELAALKST